MEKLMVVDEKKNTYVFEKNGRITINNQFRGLGRLVSPLKEVALNQKLKFILQEEGKERKLMTSPIRGCFLADEESV